MTEEGGSEKGESKKRRRRCDPKKPGNQKVKKTAMSTTEKG